jgi:hypothetical protein
VKMKYDMSYFPLKLELLPLPMYMFSAVVAAVASVVIVSCLNFHPPHSVV